MNKIGMVLVGVAFLAVFVGAFAKCGADVSGHTRIVAQTEANKWIASTKLNATADCASIDSDGDGYVSCTIVITEEQGQKTIEALECAGSFTINSGCRVPKAVIRNR